MKAWRRKDDRIVGSLRAQEAELLRGLVGQIRDMLAGRESSTPSDELAELTGIRSGPSEAPQDSILRRLLPDFHRLDIDGDARLAEPENRDERPGGERSGDGTHDAPKDYRDSAAAMRSIHEPELVALKTGVAGTVLDTCPERGGRISLDDEQAQAWLSALNDVRLALGTAIEVTEDMPERLPDDDPRSEHLAVYHWLSWAQESLVEAVQS